MRILALAAVSGLTVCAACAANDGMRFEVISLQQYPDGMGMPPPPEYTPCWTGEARGYDTNGDGKADRVKVSFKGKDRCYGEDTNHDGLIDTWDIVDDSGNLAKRAHDSNGDGKADQSWTFDPTRKGCAMVTVDRDGDGQPDGIGALNMCPSSSAGPRPSAVSSPAAGVAPAAAAASSARP